jgi:hypothetical protein
VAAAAGWSGGVVAINSSGGPIAPNHVHYAEEDGGKREFVCIDV